MKRRRVPRAHGLQGLVKPRATPLRAEDLAMPPEPLLAAVVAMGEALK
jgi:hypothetical protein